MSSFNGKVVVITGAGGGIGAATAALFSARGATVVLADRDLGAARRAAARIPHAQSARAIHLDLAEESSVQAMIGEVRDAYGRLDVLHNNAADLAEDISRLDRDVETMDPGIWDRAFQVNVRGTMLCCKHALPLMTAQGSGAIVITSSNLALQGNVIQAAYSASKAALLQLTRSIAASHGRKGIRCNAVSPGLTLTPAVAAHIPPSHRELVAAETLTPYLGEPNDIAEAVVFLASDAARYVTGHNLVVDGGTASHVPGFSQLQLLHA